MQVMRHSCRRFPLLWACWSPSSSLTSSRSRLQLSGMAAWASLEASALHPLLTAQVQLRTFPAQSILVLSQHIPSYMPLLLAHACMLL